MAVYFQPQYKPWWADLANTALKEGLSGLMKGMFERDQYARTKNRYNKEWGQMFDGVGEPQTVEQPQQSVMSVQSAPEVAAQQPGQMSTIARDGMMKDSLGISSQAPKINVPKEYLPATGDGLVALAGKANVANAIAQSQIPTRADFLRRLGTTMSPQNMELALKHAEQMYGPQWKVADQIYKGQQLENVLGAAPEINDKEGNHQYINRQYMYGLDNAANGGINFLNPEYQRQFNAAEAQKQRAFQAQEAEKSRAFTARRDAISHARQMALARQRGADLLARAMYGRAGGGPGRTGGAEAGYGGMNLKDINKEIGNAMALVAGKNIDEARRDLAVKYGDLPALEFERRLSGGGEKLNYAGKDADGIDVMLTGANPFYQNSAPVAPASVIGFSGNESDYAPDQGYSTTAYDYDDFWKNKGLGVILPKAEASSAARQTIRLPAPQNGQQGATLNFGSPGENASSTSTGEALLRQTLLKKGYTDEQITAELKRRGILRGTLPSNTWQPETQYDLWGNPIQ